MNTVIKLLTDFLEVNNSFERIQSLPNYPYLGNEERVWAKQIFSMKNKTYYGLTRYKFIDFFRHPIDSRIQYWVRNLSNYEYSSNLMFLNWVYFLPDDVFCLLDKFYPITNNFDPVWIAAAKTLSDGLKPLESTSKGSFLSFFIEINNMVGFKLLPDPEFDPETAFIKFTTSDFQDPFSLSFYKNSFREYAQKAVFKSESDRAASFDKLF
jgi:hypothetical protein